MLYRHCFSTLLLLYSYATKMAKEIRMELNLNGTHQPLVYVDDMNLLGDTISKAKLSRNRPWRPIGS
jgi:hypothetical protein